MRRLLIFRDCEDLAQQLRKRAIRRQSMRTAGVRFERRRGDRRKAVALLPYGAPPPESIAAEASPGPILAAVDEARRKAEADAIIATLNAVHWNRKTAAALLHTGYKCLLYKMKKLGLDRGPTFEVQPVAAASTSIKADAVA